MKSDVFTVSYWRGFMAWPAVALTLALVAAGMALTPTRASAIGVAPDLGTADSYAVLGGQSVTNTGPSTINGDLGVSPGSSVTGFPPGTVNGTIHAADAQAAQAQSDLTIAYDSAAGQASDATLTSPGDLGGMTLNPGVYKAASSINITGTLTLDAHGDPNAVWIFQIGSMLETASGSSVSLINGAQPCNVFWQVGSSATIGTDSSFVGTIMALTSITVDTGATIDGRALARNGSTTLDTNTITRESCAAGTGGVIAGTTGGATGMTTEGTAGMIAGPATGGTSTGGPTTGGTSTGGPTTGGPTGGPTTGGPTGGPTTGGPTGGPTTGGPGGAVAGGLLGGPITGGLLGGPIIGGLIGGTTTGGPGEGHHHHHDHHHHDHGDHDHGDHDHGDHDHGDHDHGEGG
ncbi:ice-binding family protein, partial [Streptomyces roseoverticillatus]